MLALHSVSVTSSQLLTIRQALLTYIQKFRSRFTGLNATYLKQLAVVLKALSDFAESWAKGGKREEMVSVGKVLAGGSGSGAVDQIDLRKLDEYLQRSKIARKVSALSGPRFSAVDGLTRGYCQIGGYSDQLAEQKSAAGPFMRSCIMIPRSRLIRV